MTDTPADEGTAHQGQAMTDVPTRAADGGSAFES